MARISRGRLFAAIVLVALGLGIIYNNALAGLLLGTGTGLIVFGIVGLARGGSRGSNSAAIVFGFFFALDGLWRLGLLPFALGLRYVIGVFLLILGIILLVDSIK